eukprot:SAG31_NODE_2538_length_5543_cov_13.884093_3_plen_79_part_00
MNAAQLQKELPSSPNPELFGVSRYRIITVAEPKGDDPLLTDVLKKVSGGDKIHMRPLRFIVMVDRYRQFAHKWQNLVL